MKKSFLSGKLAYLLFTSLAFGLTANAQHKIDYGNVREGEQVEFCFQNKIFEKAMQNPANRIAYQQEQAQLAAEEAAMKANPTHKRTVYVVPIVFHVLEQGGAENISDAQIYDAVRILNRDYSLQNADAALVQQEFNASNPSHVAEPDSIGFIFRLATIAPDGTCFKGITRTFSAMSSQGDDGGAQVDAIKAGNDVYRGEWPGNKYLNVFVCKNIGGAAGYTMTPNNGGWGGGGTSMKNGIWILSNYVGSIGTGNAQLSRALTHEVGHWFNLQHTWGPNNNPGDPASCSTDDGVTDTPNTIGVTSCKLNENSCGPKANVENYMDYSYCSKMFTVGQGDRMRAAINSNIGGRKNIWSAANLAAVGADGNPALCKADFTANNQVVCAGTQVNFTDESYNGVTSRSWQFEGGSPATSTDSLPTVTYNTPGTYKVVLTVSNGTDQLTTTKESYIKVISNSLPLPYFEGFENYNNVADMSTYQVVNNVIGSPAWEVTSNAAATGNKSLYIHNFTQNGDVDDFISPSIDLSGINSQVTMSFKYAVKKRSTSQESEFLVIYASKNCGQSFERKKTLTGTMLTEAVSSSDYTPAAGDWVTVHVTNITSSYFVDNFRYKIRYESKGGNNIYIDNINIYEGAPSDNPVLGVSDLNGNLSGIRLYPNPASAELNVAFNATNSGKNYVQIIDLVGHVVMIYNIHANQGLNEVLIDTHNLSNGSYLVKIGDGVSSKTLQFIKQ